MLPTPVIFLENKPVSSLSAVGTSNWLLCLEKYHGMSHQFEKLSCCLNHLCSTLDKYDRHITHGFGYDSHSTDYKILRVVIDEDEDDDDSDDEVFTTWVQVYSLARGYWKSLTASVIPVAFQDGSGRSVFVNGTFHTVEACYGNYNDGDMVIGTFKLATEEFGEMMGPEALRQDSCSIARYSLTLISHYNYEFGDRGCDIWVMRQYGVAESWTKLFNVYAVRVGRHIWF